MTVYGTSAAGRQSTTATDELAQPTLTQSGDLEPVAYTYDANGRLETLTQGSGLEARTVTSAYDANGNLSAITDALGSTTDFAYDLTGRVTGRSFPDGREVLFDYDANGNPTALTPPGRPAHAFEYTAVDLPGEYVSPNVGAGTNSTQYSYNLDKQLTQTLRPDGVAMDLAYDGAGRLITISVPEGDFTYSYDAVSGNLNQIGAPDGGTLGFTYDGSLMTGATWAGEITGSIGFDYDNDFRLASVAVNGADPVAYVYDPDSLLVQAGAMTLTREEKSDSHDLERAGEAPSRPPPHRGGGDCPSGSTPRPQREQQDGQLRSMAVDSIDRSRQHALGSEDAHRLASLRC